MDQRKESREQCCVAGCAHRAISLSRDVPSWISCSAAYCRSCSESELCCVVLVAFSLIVSVSFVTFHYFEFCQLCGEVRYVTPLLGVSGWVSE